MHFNSNNLLLSKREVWTHVTASVQKLKLAFNMQTYIVSNDCFCCAPSQICNTVSNAALTTADAEAISLQQLISH